MKNKILTIAVAIALICSIIAMGTLAYLTAQSNEGKAIKNTFTASKGLIEDPTNDPTKNGFFVLETDAKDSSKVTTTGNDYTVIPGVDLDKDAYVHIKGKTDVSAYVFVEVLETDFDKELSYKVRTDWVDLGINGNKGGKLYVYKETVNKDLDAKILVGDKIVVSKDYAAEKTGSVSFYGYMCQEASFEAVQGKTTFAQAAAAAYAACFPKKS